MMPRPLFLAPWFRATLLVLPLAFTTTSNAYTLPNGKDGAVPNENAELLQKLSRGVATIAKQANQALVSVSIYKTVQGMPNGTVDPFDYFFGPGGGGGGGGRRGQPSEPAPDRTPQKREGGLGSGFFVDLKKGYIITNNHVVQGADEIQLKLANGETFEGKIVGRDQNTDVAVVQVKKDDFDRKGLAELTLGNSETLSVGDFVVALGQPFGLEASLSFGVVSAVGRGNLDITKIGNFIQTDAAINPGNSGGPLLDMHAQVIGMNTAIYSRSGGYNGIGFAVPASLVRNIAEQLINSGHIRRGYLGVFLQPIDEELHSGLNLPAGIHGGALVAKVAPGSPAAKAGVESGDVITEVNGTAMKVHSEIVNAIGLMKPGTEVTLALYRDGKKKAVQVTIAEHPEDEGEDGQGGSKAPKSDDAIDRDVPFGMAFKTWSKALQSRYGFESKSGVVVTNVEADGPADRAGLKPGDVILKLDGKKLDSVDQLKKLAKGKTRLLVWIERAGEYYFVTLRKS